MPRSFRNLNIRTRIFLSIFVVATGLLVIMSIGVYIAFEQQLTANLDATLRLRSESNLEQLNTTGARPSFGATANVGVKRVDAESVLRLYDARGEQLADASPLSGTSPAEIAVVGDALTENIEFFRTIDLADGDAYRVVAAPIVVAGSVVGVLVTGIEWNQVDKPLQILRFTLLTAVPLTAFAIGLSGYRIARSALEPVASITATARQIAELDLNQRIEGVNSRDEIGELASTLNSMIARLHDALDRERRFSGDVSHELRTPLAAIEAGIDVTLSQSRDAGEYQRVLGVVRTQTQRLHALSRQLLMLSRLDAQVLRGDFTSIDLVEFSAAVIESFRDHHPDCGLMLVAPKEPVMILGDLELLARAISNLFENGVVHAGSEVSIRCTIEPSRSGGAAMRIEDNGPGIGVELAERIFDRFQRGEHRPSDSGTGLGLAIVDAIMRVHGGVVQLMNSSPGSGACFLLLFPALDPERTDLG